MIEFKLHCVWSMEHRCFVFTLGKHVVRINPDDMGRVIANAKDFQTRRLDNGNYNFLIEVPAHCLVVGPRGMEDCWKYWFNNVPASFCRQVIEYLEKVYTGWKKMWFGDDGQNKLRVLPCT